jgi:hypothetical protein
MVDALLLLLMAVDCCQGARLEAHAAFLACLSNPAGCTSLSIRGDSWDVPVRLTGTLPTQLGTLTAMTNM